MLRNGDFNMAVIKQTEKERLKWGCLLSATLYNFDSSQRLWRSSELRPL